LSAPDNVIYEFGPFLLDPRARKLSRDGEPVWLAAPEFEILLLLVRHRGRIVEKSEIMDAVWPNTAVEENNLTVRMSSLRRALGERKGSHQFIQTVTGRGYCLIVTVKELAAQPVTGPAEPVENGKAVQGSMARPKSAIKGFRVYPLILVGLLGSSLLYGVLRRKAAGELQASALKMSHVTHTGRVAWAAVSPDGQNIAYIERDGELHSLWLQRAGTSNALQLLPPARLTYKEPAFSRDGNTLYYSKCQPNCKLNKMPVLGGVETALPMRADSPVTFSPDGKRMAYVRTDVVENGSTEVALLTANADGSGEDTLNSRPGGVTYQGGSPAWSPDGKIIAMPILVTEGDRSHMKVIGFNVADRAELTLTAQRWRYIKDVAWLPDSSGLIINGRDEASAPEIAMQIWHVPLAGGEPFRITNDLNNYMRIGISADGRSLIALQIQWTSGLWIAPVENPAAATAVTQGTTDRHDGNLGLSMTPDGRLIYASERSGNRDLWSIKADGSNQTQLTDGSHNDTYPVVTPDGRYVVFESTRDGMHSIWRADVNGQNSMRLTRGVLDSEPACSPDGKWVIYVADDGQGNPRLRKVSIEGGDPVSLTEQFSQHPAISPDGKMIAYYFMDQKQRERRNIVIIPAQGGAPIKTLPAPKNFGSVMRWAPAGDSLTYRNNTLSSLWRLPIDGTDPNPLIDLSGQRLHSFCYSQDGRRLAYASGLNLSDVILITH
jgi:Tol biopolymer transport system component/DNA-binding winged helix-turn-helix (wHTH) protein